MHAIESWTKRLQVEAKLHSAKTYFTPRFCFEISKSAMKSYTKEELDEFIYYKSIHIAKVIEAYLLKTEKDKCETLEYITFWWRNETITSLKKAIELKNHAYAEYLIEEKYERLYISEQLRDYILENVFGRKKEKIFKAGNLFQKIKSMIGS